MTKEEALLRLKAIEEFDTGWKAETGALAVLLAYVDDEISEAYHRIIEANLPDLSEEDLKNVPF